MPLIAVYFETLLFDWTLQLYASLRKRFVNNSVFVACHPPRFHNEESATSASVKEVALAATHVPAVSAVEVWMPEPMRHTRAGGCTDLVSLLCRSCLAGQPLAVPNRACHSGEGGWHWGWGGSLYAVQEGARRKAPALGRVWVAAGRSVVWSRRSLPALVGVCTRLEPVGDLGGMCAYAPSISLDRGQ